MRMKQIKTLIKKDGLLFLAVPVGWDHVTFNEQRVYGYVRFPMLTEGWEVLGMYEKSSYPEKIFEIHPRDLRQPIFVLRPQWRI
jgi:hypothetical protein